MPMYSIDLYYRSVQVNQFFIFNRQSFKLCNILSEAAIGSSIG
jgi:hypothetical protein